MLTKVKSLLSSKKRVLVLVVALVPLAILAKNTFFKSPPVTETAKVARGTIDEKLTISGKIAAEQDVVLTFQTGGLLSWVGVKTGDTVKKYQAIASLDQRQVKKNIQKYLNTYEKSRDTFENTQYTYKDSTLWTDAIRRILHGSQMDLDNAVIDVQIQDLARQMAVLTSPIDGIVVRADVMFPGVNVAPLSTGFEIVNPASIYFSVNADQTEVTALKLAMPGNLTLDSFPDNPITGSISSIAFTPNEDQSSTVYEVKFKLDTQNKDYLYKIGMTGDVSFVTKSALNTLYLPSKFIRSDGKNSFVTLQRNNKLSEVPVVIGLISDENTEIKSGLTEGDLVSL